jgi:hypothetical protein
MKMQNGFDEIMSSKSMKVKGSWVLKRKIGNGGNGEV